ncbi:SCO family protein [Novosphingobium album (ex Hu et al. 2023)]|uniref:SCO family protein n=1 Tax=Novosphingobium album (ex Hu et al. 2023) TaxID=2930093 RepID=A0ABT0B1H2_9SPHN|nr:SCO family protein [Novosphingobium album (ex Hu et al. 2023)]MCJ2178907.1 SCO family protein [Novosphingobium album (ex Hu et al. 2023)]
MNRHAMTYRKSRFARIPFALAACLALSMPLAACQQQQTEQPPLEGAAIGGPFTLVNKNGKTVTWAQFKGEWRIVYFGYTFCPDACPLDVQAMMRGFNLFTKAHPDLAAKVQPIFISIDPARDTPEVVGEWTGAFGPRLMGLTGTPKQVNKAADAFAVYHKRGADTAGGYLMDHSRISYLMDPDGKPIAMLPTDKGPDAVAAELAKWVQ